MERERGPELPAPPGEADVFDPAALEGELRCGPMRLRLVGRTLRLVIWLASQQRRINDVAPESGQLWVTWKGWDGKSIAGDLRTHL